MRKETKDNLIVQLTKKERELLSTLVGVMQKLLNPSNASIKASAQVKTRRSFDQIEAMKKAIFVARKKTNPVREIAEKLGVTPSYIYQLERK